MFPDQCGRSINLSKKQLSDDEIVCRLSMVKSDEVEIIDLSENSIGPETLQHIVCQFHNVKNLKLRRCKLSKPEMTDQLKSIITMLPKLESIDLYENNLADEGIESLIPGLKSAVHLKNINCGKNKITSKGLEALSKRISSENITFGITALSLASNKIDRNSFHALKEILVGFPNLEQFDIGHNNLGQVAPEVTKCLPKSLKMLSFKNCKLNHVDKDSFSRALSALPNLVSLNLGSNNLEDGCIDIVAPLLQKNKHFEELRLFDCHISSDGMTALCTPLFQLKFLTALTLSKNYIQVTGAEALSKPLPYLTELKELWLSDNELYDHGLISLVPGLTNLKKLRILALNGNEISDEGAKSLAKPLQGFDSLQRLYLYDNRIGDNGIIALLKSLTNAADLEKMVLNSNMIEETGLFRLMISLKQNMKNIKEVSLQNNSFSGEFQPELKKLSKKLGIKITS